MDPLWHRIGLWGAAVICLSLRKVKKKKPNVLDFYDSIQNYILVYLGLKYLSYLSLTVTHQLSQLTTASTVSPASISPGRARLLVQLMCHIRQRSDFRGMCVQWTLSKASKTNGVNFAHKGSSEPRKSTHDYCRESLEEKVVFSEQMLLD